MDKKEFSTITDKKNTISSQSNQEELHTILKQLADVYFRIKPDGNILDYESKNHGKLFFKSKNISGKKIQQIMPAEIAQKFVEALDALNESKDFIQFEFSYKVKSVEKYFEVRIIKLPDNQLSVIIRSINSVTSTEKVVDENIRPLSVLMNNLPGLAFRCLNDKNWTMKFVSKGSLKLTGYKNTDFIDNHRVAYADIIHDDDKEHVYNAVQSALEEKGPYQITYRIITKSKKISYVLEQGKGIYKKDGSVEAIEGYITDINDVIAAREALKQSENKFKSLVEKSLIGVYIIQKERLVYVNPIFTRLFGYDSSDEIYKLHLKDLVHDKDRDTVLNNVQKRISGKIETVQYSFNGLKKDKTTFNAEVIGSRTIFNGEAAVIGTLIDISEKILYEKELKESRERLSLLVEAMPDGIVIMDMRGMILFSNNAALKLAEIPVSDESNKRNIKDFIHPDYIELVEKEISLMKTRNEGSLSEYKINTISGKEKWVESLAKKYNFSGTPSILVTIRDISDRKRSQEEISLLNYALHSAANGILITDREGSIIWANNAFTKLTGYSLKEAVGRSTRILKSGLTDKNIYIDLWSTISTGRVWRGELINRRKDGTVYNEEMTVTPVKIPSSDKQYYIAVKQNITERKLVEEELRDSKNRAEEMNKLKSNFLANMSHELRTPLVGILGFAEMLNEELSSSNLKEMSESILSSGKRLMETLNYILDLSKVESNKIELSYKKIRIADIIKETVKTFEAVAAKRGLYFRIFLENDDYVVRLDEQLLRGIVNNLINNALKFTHQGGITVEVYRHFESSKTSIAISIKDTGIGIPADKLQLIFEEFRQASEGLNRTYEGTGLGLTITKKFIEVLNGKITVESVEGKGSTFTVLFPEAIKIEPSKQIKLNVDRKEQVRESNSKRRFEVLLVENDEASINVTQTFLKDFCNIDTVKDGSTALQKAKLKNYDAIIMDIDLGWGINGMEVTQELKKMEKYIKTPIIAVTAYAMKGDREAFLRAGCTHYLAKPFDKSSILSLIQAALAEVRK